MLLAANQSDSMILVVVDVILVFYGIYCVISARKMKETGVPIQWLVSSEEIPRLRNPKKFCELLAPKTIQFGIICIIYGLFAIAESLWIHIKLAQISGIFIFIICMLWYVTYLQKVRKEYIHTF